jgi:CRISPR-associated protein Cas1
MIKRTLYFGNPAYLKASLNQLLVQTTGNESVTSIPIEDIGLVVLDHQQITITHGALGSLLENNAAIVTCNLTHHPIGLLLTLDGNTLQSQKFKAQIEASTPLKKQLWQQTVIAKIENQANLLAAYKKEHRYLLSLAANVKSGDSANCEAKAASYYWKRILPENLEFSRDRYGNPPNNLLNYGYAILRASVARSLVGSGLLPTLGIFHKNQYNAYCLADDIMEPYRPFVDRLVLDIVTKYQDISEITIEIKKRLLTIPALDVHIGGKKSPLFNAIARTTASLAKCFEGDSRKILYPILK